MRLDTGINRFRNIMIIFFLLVFFSSYSIALHVSDSYSIENIHTGLAGSVGNSESYTFKSTLTHNTPTSKVQSVNYYGNVGWYKAIVVTGLTLENGTVNITCSNNSVDYYSCDAFSYNDEITHIRTQCTNISQVQQVQHFLYNQEDNNYYIDNQSYTYESGGYYYYNASYFIEDSGNWVLSVECINPKYSYEGNETFSISFGTLFVENILPNMSIEVQQNQMFTFQTRVTCVGGECGDVNAILDPMERSGQKIVQGVTLFDRLIIGVNDFFVKIKENLVTGFAIFTNGSINESDNLTFSIETNATLNATEDSELNATTNATVNVTEDSELNATTNATVNVTEDSELNATTNATLNATGDSELNATTNATVNVTEDTEINLTTNETHETNETENETINLLEDEIVELEIKEIESENKTTLFIDKEKRFAVIEVLNETILSEKNIKRKAMKLGKDKKLEKLKQLSKLKDIKRINKYKLKNNSKAKIRFNKSNVSIKNYKLIVPDADNEKKLEKNKQNISKAINGSEKKAENTSVEFETPILAVEVDENVTASIVIPKFINSSVSVILKCPLWNFENDTCVGDWINYTNDLDQNETDVWFNVTSFSAYAGGNLSDNELSHLVIWDDNDAGMPNVTGLKLTNESVNFFADYKDSKTGQLIYNATCSISFEDIGSSVMYHNVTYDHYMYTRNFSTEANYDYNISCDAIGYNDYQVKDNIIISMVSKSGAISTITGSLPFYTVDNNPQNCSSMKGGDTCLNTWSVNATGPDRSSHTFFVIYDIIEYFNNISDANTDNITINITLNDTVTPIILNAYRYPAITYNNSNVSVFLTASDNVQLDTCYANISDPSAGSTILSDICNIQQKYFVTELGYYNITYFVNDTSGNNITYMKTFEVRKSKNVKVNTNTDNTSEVKFTLTDSNSSEVVLEDTLNESSNDVTTPEGIYDVGVGVYEDNLSITLKDVNVSSNDNKTILLDRFNESESLQAYGVETDYNYTVAEMRISYRNVIYTHEDTLYLYKCDNWNFTQRLCMDDWNDVTDNATQDTINKQFLINVTSFSGFRIIELLYCGDGYCDSPESCTSCPSDCGNCPEDDSNDDNDDGSSSSTNGGGSGGLLTVEEIEMIEIKQKLFVGEKSNIVVSIPNIDAEYTAQISMSDNLKNIIIVSDSISLSPTKKIIDLEIIGGRKGNYQGELYIEFNHKKYIIPINVDVVSVPDKVIDVKVSLDKIEFLSDENIGFIIDVKNLEEGVSYDIEIVQEIYDLEGNLITSKTETAEIKTSLKLAREIEIPGNLKDGQYKLVVKGIYNNNIVEAEKVFNIKNSVEALEENPTFFLKVNNFHLIGGGFAILIFMLLVISLFIYHQSRVFVNDKLRNLDKSVYKPYNTGIEQDKSLGEKYEIKKDTQSRYDIDDSISYDETVEDDVKSFKKEYLPLEKLKYIDIGRSEEYKRELLGSYDKLKKINNKIGIDIIRRKIDDQIEKGRKKLHKFKKKKNEK